MRSTDGKPEPFFLPTEIGHLFAIYYPPQTGTSHIGDLLYVHPFAEEMNKSRRMVALQARDFSKNGWGVLLVDLYGCGDSWGDFAEARWHVWKENLQVAVEWLHKNGTSPLSLWGLRLGCLLMMDFAEDSNEIFEKFVLWQPIVSGKIAITQFLRLKVVSEMTEKRKVTTQDLRRRLTGGQSLEVAGYQLPPDLAGAIDALRLDRMSRPNASQIHWLEVVPHSREEFSPPSLQVIEAWKNADINISAKAVKGDPFWTTTEITVVPELISTTTKIFRVSVS